MSTPDAPTEPYFDADTKGEDDCLRVVLRGELDLATVLDAESEISTAISRTSRLIVDLTQLEFIDSTGIRLMSEMERLARAESCALSLTRGTKAVQRALEVSGMDKLLRFEC
jgi:anti-sigma B factor antagonist